MTYAEAGEALAAQTPRFYRVRFEDIQANAVAELTKMASFCDLTFTDRQIERAGRLDRDVQAGPAQAGGQRNQFGEKHRLAASEHRVRAVCRGRLANW